MDVYKLRIYSIGSSTHIITIDVGCTKITDIRLKNIDVGWNDITDAGIILLTKKIPYIECLAFIENRDITDQTVMAILQNRPKIQLLDMQHSGVTRECVDNLKISHPFLTIVYHID